MDAPTAALIGAALGFGGALFAAWLNPFATARHAKAAKNLELRREAYATGLLATERFSHAFDVASVSQVLASMGAAHASMQLVCSPDIAKLYFEVIRAVAAIGIYTQEHSGDHPPPELSENYRKQYLLFVEAARADIGIDELYYRK